MRDHVQQEEGRTAARARSRPPADRPAGEAETVMWMQRSIGNAKTTRFLSDHRQAEQPGPAAGEGLRIQRAPGRWHGNRDVEEALKQAPGRGNRSRWPAVTEALRAYMGIADDGDVGQRREVLDRLVSAIEQWRANQRDRMTVNLPGSAAGAKKQILESLDRMIQFERAELEAPAAAPAAPTPAVPIGVPGAGARARAGSAQSSESDSDDDDKLDFSRAQQVMATARPLPRAVQLHVHMTNKKNLASIAFEGILPGASKGIGTPEGGSDKHNIYLLSDSADQNWPATEIKNATVVGVLSSDAPYSKDPNYDKGAWKSHEPAYPVGDPEQRNRGFGPYSLTFPLNAESRRGIAAFLNMHRTSGEPQFSEGDAVRSVVGRLLNDHFLHMKSSSLEGL